MEKPRVSMATKALTLLSLLTLTTATDSPQYIVVHKESDFEIRHYKDATWMSAPVTQQLSFQKASLLGFHRLFQYTQGANLNLSRIPMTSPVVTSIVRGAGPFQSSAYFVRLYLPVKFQVDPPVGLPELKLKPYRWNSHCVAVRKFSKVARDQVIVKEAEKLAISLGQTQWANATWAESSYAYSIAQYDSPYHISGRNNEVWADLDASTVDGCQPSIATY